MDTAARDILPANNLERVIRCVRQNLSNSVADRFEFKRRPRPPLQRIEPKDYQLVYDSLAMFTPWGPYYGSTVLASGTDVLTTYFRKGARVNRVPVTDWDRITLLINPAIAIAGLFRPPAMRATGDPMSNKEPSMQSPAFPPTPDDPSDNRNESDRNNPPPFNPREQSFITGFLRRQGKRRKDYSGGPLRVMANAKECALVSSISVPLGGAFQVPLYASFFEVFGSDRDGDLLLAVFPLEPADEERVLASSHARIRIESTIPPVAVDADEVTVQVACVPEPVSPLSQWCQHLWSRAAFWRRVRTADPGGEVTRCG